MTFLQIINVIKETSLAQPNVNSFYREFLDLNREDIEYSSIILQDRDSELSRVSEQDWMTYTFHLGYVDRLTDDESNRDHIFSTGITVLGSIINSMRSTWGSTLDVIVEDRIVTFNQRFTANCAGVYLVIGITVPMSDCTDAAQTDIYGKYEARITDNGDYHILPDGPVSEIDITIDIPSDRKPEETFSVTPSSTVQTIVPQPGYTFSSGTVEAVTSDVDPNILPGNIRTGVSILGVEGTMNPQKTEVGLEENIYSNGTYDYAPSGDSVFDSVKINVSVPSDRKPEMTFSVTPSSQQQVVTPQPGYVFSSGIVEAVTSSVDSNITSGNIRNGVEILGVTGTVEERKPEMTFSVTPSSTSQTITPDPGYVFSSGTVAAVTSSVDSNIVPSNIRSGVSILGVEGTMNPQKTEVSLSERITSNGSYTYSPEEGETFGSVDVTVAVPSDRKPEMTFSVTPSSTVQTIIPDTGYVFSSGTVAAVTSSVDPNILPGNIKEGVTILGVEGTFEGGKTEVSLNDEISENATYYFYPKYGEVWNEVIMRIDVHPTSRLTRTITSNCTTSISGEWKDAEITVAVPSDRKPEMTFSVTPSSTVQTIIPDQGYVFSSGTVAAVTSSVDSNIVSGNIRSGVSILGVTGTMNPEKTEETLSRTITENGSYSYSPSSGSVFGSASITVSVPGTTIPKPANDEIYYVSYNGYTITPSDSSDFGATLVSNTVHSSGNYCVLKFDGTVTKTGYNSFRGSIRLKEIYLPDSVTVISQSSFQESGLQRCVMQDTVTEIRGSAFDGCFALISPFRISKGCTSIGGSALRNCQALVTVTIPSSVTSINVRAFYGSSNIRDVIVQATTPPTLIQSSGNYTQFDGCTNLQRIRVPSGSVVAYKLAEGWGNWAGIIIADYE